MNKKGHILVNLGQFKDIWEAKMPRKNSKKGIEWRYTLYISNFKNCWSLELGYVNLAYCTLI